MPHLMLSMRCPLFLLVVWITPLVLHAEETGEVDYLRDVKPILSQRCYRCHSNLEQESGLRVDSIEAIKQGGDRGAAIESGDAKASLLISAVVGGDELQMPPEGPRLTDQQIAILRRWIDGGAAGSTDAAALHWAFRAPERPAIPADLADEWTENPIDAFLNSAHRRAGLQAAREADPAILLRRVYLDLIGLPPTPEQLDAFLADPSPDAYGRVVDQLLESPQHGERWGRHWMDIWRYSDWSGYRNEVRNSQPHIWRWRDWIVQSLNTDKPYDQMVREMLAGDELAPADPDILPATGYLVRNWYKFNRNTWLQNTVDHTAKAFLGLTLGCARCHDHMYDPIALQDYYQFRAFFEPHQVRTDRVPDQPSTDADGIPRVYDADLEAKTFVFLRGDDRTPDESQPLEAGLPTIFGDTLPVEPVDLPPLAYYPGLRPHELAMERDQAERKIKQLAAELEKLTKSADKAAADDAASAADTGSEADSAAALATQHQRRQLIEKQQASAIAARDALEARIAAATARYLQNDADETCDELATAAHRAEKEAARLQAEADLAAADIELLDATAQLEADAENDKLKKAKTDAEKKQQAAAKQLEEATAASQQPPQPTYTSLGTVYPNTSSGRRLALARWITDRNNPLTARVAVNHIWLRHFGSALVPTVDDFGMNGQPPTHPELLDWLAVEFMDNGWRMKHLHRLIVTSRAYRMASGGDEPSFAENRRKDPDNRYLWRYNARRMEAEIVRDCVLHVAGRLDEAMGGPDLDHASGQTTHRRSVYYQHAYEKQMTFLKLFDVANVEECYRRGFSVVPQQALALANSPLAIEQSRLLAAQLTGNKHERLADAEFVRRAYVHLLNRPPLEAEQTACLSFLQRQRELLAEPGSLEAFTTGKAAGVQPSADPAQRARENLVHVLLNHNEFVTIR